MKAAGELSGARQPWPYAASPDATLPVVLSIGLVSAALGVAVAFGELDALIISAGVLASALIVIDFRVGVVLLIALMPISGSDYFPHQMFGLTGLNPVNLLMVATFGSYLFYNLFRERLSGFLPGPLLWLYLVPIVIAGLIGARNVSAIPPDVLARLNFDGTAGYLRDMVVKPLLLVLFGLLVGAAVVRSKRPERLLAPFLVSIWSIALLMFWFLGTSGLSLTQMSSGTGREFLAPLGQHANDLGRFFAVAYAILLYAWAVAEKPGLKTVLFSTMAVSVLALGLTFSRGAFVAFALITFLFLASRRQLVLSLIAAALVFAIVLVFLPPEFLLRSEYGFDGGGGGVSAGRVDNIWLPLLPDLWRSPIWGSGLSSILWSRAMLSESIPRITHPHNAYLATLLDMGVIGLVLLCAYFAHAWRNLRRLATAPELGSVQRGMFEGAAAGLVGFLFVGLVDAQLVPVWEQTLLWVMLGMMYGYMEKRRATQAAA